MPGLPPLGPEDCGTRLIDDEVKGLSKAGTCEDPAGDEAAGLAPLVSGRAGAGFNEVLPETRAGPCWFVPRLVPAEAGVLSPFFIARLAPATEPLGREGLDGPAVSLPVDGAAARTVRLSPDTAAVRTPSALNVRLGGRSGFGYGPGGSGRGSSMRLATSLALSAATLDVASDADGAVSVPGGSLTPRWA
jgi:hypothetical protein